MSFEKDVNGANGGLHIGQMELQMIGNSGNKIWSAKPDLSSNDLPLNLIEANNDSIILFYLQPKQS